MPKEAEAHSPVSVPAIGSAASGSAVATAANTTFDSTAVSGSTVAPGSGLGLDVATTNNDPATSSGRVLASTTDPLPVTQDLGTVAHAGVATEPSAHRPSTPIQTHNDHNTITEPSQEQPVTPIASTSIINGSHSFAPDNAKDLAMLDAPAVDNAIGTSTQEQALLSQLHHQSHHAVNVPAADQYQPSTPYRSTSTAALNQHAYMMMALASMSGAASAMSPPPTVTPSQVTLPNTLGEPFNGLTTTNAMRQAGAEKGLESFARIEFADSVFQMTTYAVIVGRDQRALEQARRDEKRADEYKRRVEENASRGLPPPSPILHDRSKFSKSYVSEEGGMLGPESDSEETGRPAKRRKTSTAGSSQHEKDDAQENVISNRQYVSHTPGAAAVDLASLRPSPWHVPIIGIHSPGPNIASKTKAISREHLKISYNQEEGVFEAIPLHKNGFFCEDVHYKSDKVILKCGDRLQIKDIDFRFMINGVERGCTGAEEYLEETATKKRYSQGGKEMSFDFEQSHGNGEIQDTSDELSDVDVSPAELSDFGVEDGEEEEEEEEEAEDAEDGDELEDVDDADDAEDIEDAEDADDVDAVEDADGDEPMGDGSELIHNPDSQPDFSMPQMPKKRGPGRPPKNGIMSKREQRLLKKQQQEMAKKTLPQAPPIEPPIKRKVGRPRKHPLPDNASDRPEKRKYKPRKPKGEDGVEGSDAERRAREKKEKKARPKSPPLELKIEEYTEEQLQKPNKNYGVLIDETLTAAGPDGLTLKQIYKRICQRYPWFYFHTETKGWESSVRHNLIGNEAFKKDETTNLWSRVPGVELDAGKKRKATSPDRSLAAAQAYGPYSYPYNAQHMAPGAPPGFPPGQPPPGYQLPGYNGQPGMAGRPVQYGTSASPPGQPAQLVGSQPPAPTQLPGYGPPPAPARRQLGVPHPGAYSSPYASRPPPPATPPVTAEGGNAPCLTAPRQQPLPVAPAAVGTKTLPGVAPTPQQAPLQSGNRPSQTPPLGAPFRPVIETRLLSAVVNLKNGLVENLKKARNPKAEAIVMSALNRCIGLKKEATENDKMEAICIKGIRQVIDGFTKGKAPNSSGSGAPPDTPLIFEAKVLASMNGFKEVSIKALKGRLGESRAEAVTLSAIDRVIGLADASIVPQSGEGESTGNFEGVEQHLMKSIRQLLMGMNQKLQDNT